jgi:hypothetical protein
MNEFYSSHKIPRTDMFEISAIALATEVKSYALF